MTAPESSGGDERFRAAFESAPTAMIMVDARGRIVLTNVQAERLFGYSSQELLSQSIDALVPERFRQEHLRHRSEFQADPQARALGADRELYGLRKDGVEIPVEIGLNPIETDRGAFVLAAVIDISERRRIQKAVARLASMVEHSGDAMISATLGGVILSWNQGAARIFGRSAGEMLGASLDALVEVAEAIGLAERRERIRHGEEFLTFEMAAGASGLQSIDLLVTLSAVRDEDGAAIALSMVARDVTEFKRLQEAVVRSKSLAAVGEMAATVAHEIRNPLAAISGPLQILAKQMAAEDPRRSLIHEILGQVKRLDGTVRGLLSISKEHVPRKEPVPVKELVDNIARLMAEHEAGRGVRVSLEGDPEIELLADPALLEQVLWNLFLNAAEAMKGDGDIKVSVRSGPATVEVAIADSGGGIPAELLPRLFHPFVTTKPLGNGLGLSLCRKIVEAHGGRIEITSDLNRGTTVRLELPKS